MSFQLEMSMAGGGCVGEAERRRRLCLDRQAVRTLSGIGGAEQERER